MAQAPICEQVAGELLMEIELKELGRLISKYYDMQFQAVAGAISAARNASFERRGIDPRFYTE